MIRLVIFIAAITSLVIASQSLSWVQSDVTLAQSKTIYVNGSYRSEIEDRSIAHPFKTVTRAIAAATDGDTIVIQAGVYLEAPLFNK